MKHSIDLLREAFQIRLDADNFYDLRITNQPASIHEFVDSMTAGNLVLLQAGLSETAQFPDLTNLEITFAELMDMTIQVGGVSHPISTFFRDLLCASIAIGLVNEIARNPPLTPLTETTLAEVGATTWREWAQTLSTPVRLAALAENFSECATEALASRKLISFFIKAPVEGKFSIWGSGAVSGIGRKLPTRVVEGEGYSVTIKVSRYEEVECSVAAYEWHATLTLQGENEPSAACCGMVYIFDRDAGELVGDLNDLVMASDSMADSDVMQVKAFITQHGDAANVIEKSDLCFVWIWERRAGSEKGIGAKCLRAALDDLRRRFKKMRTSVFDARPAQFANWSSMVDPPMVAMAKQAAVESLVSYIEEIKLDFDVRAIFARSDDPFGESLVAVGQALDAMVNDGGQDGYVTVDEIDLAKWEDEITEMLFLGGLNELAESFGDGGASDDEVLAAIKHIIFDSRVHYLRPQSSGRFDPLRLEDEEVVPHSEAHEQIEGMDEFCRDLPGFMKVVAVRWLDDFAICTVMADTPFGDVIEHFTLVRKPRPVNVESFFRHLSRKYQ